MCRKLIFIFLMSFLFSLSIAQEKENILVVNGETLYFSIAGHINWKYYKIEETEYSKILKTYYIKRTQEIGHKDNMFGPTELNLPDSLSNDFLEIKKGFYCIKVDSLKLTPKVINGFKTTTSIEGSGKSRVIVSISDTIDKNWKELFIFSKNYNTLKQITPSNPKIIQDDKINTMIQNSIVDYFFNNRDVLKRQLTYKYTIADSLSDIQLKNEISSKYDLRNYEINDKCFIVEGIFSEYHYNKFFALVFPNENKVLVKTHTKLYQSFKINDDYFFFCQSFLPYAGGNIFWVYKLIEDKLEPVFIDGSYSM